jgi:phage shock protein E
MTPRQITIIKIYAIFTTIFAVILFVFLAANNNPSKQTTQTTKENPYEISLTRIRKNLSNKSLLIDVRTPEEYANSHAQTAINLPLSDIQGGITPKSDKSEIIYVYCRSGKRATTAKLELERQGFRHVINLGGLVDWRKLGGKITSKEPIIKNNACKNSGENGC